MDEFISNIFDAEHAQKQRRNPFYLGVDDDSSSSDDDDDVNVAVDATSNDDARSVSICT